jgi:hypothetical protein
MPLFNAYYVYPGDKFNSADYPEIEHELAALTKGIRFMPGYGKVGATVSFLKDHSVKSEWVKANPVLIDMIRFGAFNVMRIEKMFEACRDNPAFLRDFEKYIYNGLDEKFE